MDEQKLIALEDIGAITLGHRPVGPGFDPWFATFAAHVEIGNGATLTSIHGNGQTPDDAVADLFELVTTLDKGEFLVVRRNRQRIHLKWTGHGFRIFDVRPSP